MYSEEKAVIPTELDPTRAAAVCPACGAEIPFLRLPLFVVIGASGAGKSALVQWAAAHHRDCVHLESDILWGRVNVEPEGNYAGYRNLWLRVCKNISQAGRPVVLYGSVTPEQWEVCPERRYLGAIHTLALVCGPETLAERLRARPTWRSMGGSEAIEGMQRFNAWFKENAGKVNPPMTLLDTTTTSIEATGAALLHWIRQRWNPAAGVP